VKGLLQVICLANDVTGFAKSYLFGYCTSSSGFLFMVLSLEMGLI
jgi:hypothetical protein